MSKKQYTRFEKRIYVEKRCEAFRFKVAVSPHSDSATFSSIEEGALWTRLRRVEFLEVSAGSAKAHVQPEVIQVAQNFPHFPFLLKAPATIKLSDFLDSFERDEISKLAGKTEEASRLRNLRKWLCDRTLDELDESFIGRWKIDRLSGKLGSGRDPNRAVTMSGNAGEKPLTKHQRYTRKKAGKEVTSQPIYPVSTQTVRHDLKLLQRAVTKCLKKKPVG